MKTGWDGVLTFSCFPFYPVSLHMSTLCIFLLFISLLPNMPAIPVILASFTPAMYLKKEKVKLFHTICSCLPFVFLHHQFNVSGFDPSASVHHREATTVVIQAAAALFHSPELHLKCSLSQGGNSHWLIVAAQELNLTERESWPLSLENSKVSIFCSLKQLGVLSDGGGAVKAKSQQIHLLSTEISLCNWRQFVSSQCQQIWKHYVKKPWGKNSCVCCDKHLYACKRFQQQQQPKHSIGYADAQLLMFTLQSLKLFQSLKEIYAGIWSRVNSSVLQCQQLRVQMMSMCSEMKY